MHEYSYQGNDRSYVRWQTVLSQGCRTSPVRYEATILGGIHLRRGLILAFTLQDILCLVHRPFVRDSCTLLPQEAWKGPRWEVVAGFGLLKGGRADWLVEKCVELGAHSLIPLVSERVHAAGGVEPPPLPGRQHTFRRLYA